MFDELLKTTSDNIFTVRSMIQTNEKLRDILFGKGSTSKNSDNESLDLTSLKTTVPNVDDWRIYDHCSIVTRLYAIYENFLVLKQK